PFESTTHDDGYLCLFANLYNNYLDPRIGLDNSVVFPTLDCSEHSSVVIRFETSFMNYSAGVQYVEVSNDDGVHWAAYDCGFGTGHKDRPNDVAPGVPAIFQANISEVAAGMSEVIFKITWKETSMYYWVIDDLTISEAWDNDLQLQHFTLEWDDGDDDTEESTTYMMPKSQMTGSFFNFQSSVLNFGEKDQNDYSLEVDISKNGESVFNEVVTKGWLDPLYLDTTNMEGSYTPVDYGHYKITYDWTAAETEQTPEDNGREIFFHVTDSVYSRADETMDISWAYGFERYTYGFGEEFWNIDHFAGMRFPIYADCEVDGVSVYITGGWADGLIDFRYTLYWLPPPEEDPDGEGAIEWLTTESLMLDSAMFGTWVYLPFDKDGESEFMFAGDMVYAGIQYNNFHDEELDRRNYNLQIGADMSNPRKDPRSIGWTPVVGWDTGNFIGQRNLMIKLFINNHENRIDNVDLVNSLNSLDQNYPNPFKRSTEISYELGQAQDVSIEITDMTGRTVMLVDQGRKPAGTHTYMVNAQSLESGIYFYTLKAGQYEETKRMIVSR
ncbi:MAG: T9SS type A sorting domain-containing protein, partial [Bacteroidota bacterium]|nr:T9SS type A sorting domain-containing protein [Bacteroidota bacterium]